MAGSVASRQETRGAEAFLRYLGDDWHNKALVLAVVAWFRQESGSISKVVGNNPFNIRPGVATKWSSGVRRSKRPGGGYFLIFPDLDTGFRAAALVLKTLAPSYGYGQVLKALKDTSKNAPLYFLGALAMSKWDSAHYGVLTAENQFTLQNHLIVVYQTLTGGIFAPPSAASGGSAKPSKRRRGLPSMPIGLRGPVAQTNPYIDPFAVIEFYGARPHATIEK